ncbi:integral membrane protein [Lineolata rhizophorae]|uniref:Integral membrane protein n=1 Tax=Lineolata rhizophorae TaxID=578093 RepID=A0A6A6P0J8_9PEZI|nr:integral membrane protein [Lineolata rhizophorae]
MTAASVFFVTCVTGIGALLVGLVTVMLPVVAGDVGLEDDLLLWPASIYALICGCALLLSGSVADVIGVRTMYLLGCFLQSVFTMACGLPQDGLQLILFRALAGIAISFCLPSSVGIITNTFPPGKRRNVAFAAMGGGQPIGFSIGLTVGGFSADGIGWEWGFHMAAIFNTIIFVVAWWGMPKNIGKPAPVTWDRFLHHIDWVGAIIASASLGMMSYVFVVLTGRTSSIKDSSTIALLVTSICLIPAFVFWVGRQERIKKPALILNSFWRNRVFTTICLNVFMTWGTFNAIENLLTFYFQEVQHLSASRSSLLFLATPISGAITNIFMGAIVHRVRADALVLASTVLSCAWPALMAVAESGCSYSASPFPGLLLIPVAADALFTVANLLITSVLDSRTQGLAGGVFNTVAQVGKSVGLATSAVIASSAAADGAQGEDQAMSLLEGYRAAFWYCLALNAVTVAVSIWGLRRIGRVGVKRD